jgi:Ca2+-binding RTX toxin-like protein
VFRFQDGVAITENEATCTGNGTNTVDCTPGGSVDSAFITLGPGTNEVFTASGMPASVTLWVAGEAGADTITSGPGDDKLFGGAGGDTINGGSGDDTITEDELFLVFDLLPAGSGTDTFRGGDGDDMLDGGAIANSGAGADTMDGDGDTDTADYSERTAPVILTLVANATGNDGQAGEGDNLAEVEQAIGGDAADDITGTDGVNRLEGGPGADVLRGGSGPDTLYGGRLSGAAGSGDDVLDGGAGGDDLRGGDGKDTVSYAGQAGPVTIKQDEIANDGATGENDNVRNDVEVLAGTDGGDTVAAGSGDNEISGAGGADSLEGGEGNDTVDGGAGADTVAGGVGNDTLDAGTVADSLEGGTGDDTIRARDGAVDSISCGAGNDTVEADTADVVFVDCENVQRPAAPATTPPPSTGGTTSAPTPTTPIPPIPPSTTLTRVSLTFGSTRLRLDRRGRVRLRITCPAQAGGACRGTLALTARNGRRTLRLGSVGIGTAAGRTATVTIAISRAGRSLIRRRRSLAATATLTPSAGSPLTAATKRLTLLRR